MNIILPRKKGITETDLVLDFDQLVVVGANGSGKTRFGAIIEENYSSKTHRISAQKSLSFPSEVRPKSLETAREELWYGSSNDAKKFSSEPWFKGNNRWGRNRNTSLLDDYEKLLVLLHTEEYESLSEAKSLGIISKETKIDRVRNAWEKLLPHRKLKIRAGVVESFPTGKPEDIYNAKELSDGERVIFYLIGEVICAPETSIIIIDEPELHIHKSLVKNLFDLIENERRDCAFIYLTHDIDFAFSRQNAHKIWAKSYEGSNIWDYEILSENEIPEQLYLEILGSRKPILFIEGDKTNSIDEKLLELVFSEYTVKSLGSCEKVFSTTKAFNEQNTFHNISAIGLIDRDRRTEDEIAHINNSNIWVAEVAEIENYLLLEEVVKVVAKNMHKDEGIIFSKVKANLLNFFKTQIEKQALEHTIHRIEKIFKTVTDNSSIKKFEELESSLGIFWTQKDFKGIYDGLINDFKILYENGSYKEILKVFNNKGIVANSNVVSLCDLNTKNNAYLNFVIGILKQQSEDAARIKKAIIENINKRHTTLCSINGG